MGMEITHLGSGSAGNSTLLRSEETNVLIDCGFSLKQMEARLKMVDVDPTSIAAILFPKFKKLSFIYNFLNSPED